MYSHVETAVSERCVFGMMSLSLDISRKQWEDRKIYGHFRSIDILSKSAQMHVSHSEVEYWIACFPYRLYFTNTLWTSRVIFSEQKKCMRSFLDHRLDSRWKRISFSVRVKSWTCCDNFYNWSSEHFS